MKLYFALLVLPMVFGADEEKRSYCEQMDNSPNIRTFWETLVKIAMPCKYNAVRQTCGDFYVNVAPGVIGLGFRFRLNTIWMGVTKNRGQDNEEYFGARTTNKKAVKFINGNTTEFFTQRKGDMNMSHVLDFEIVTDDSGLKMAVAKEKNGAFTLSFSPWDPTSDVYTKSRWKFECHEDFFPDPYPAQVCGGNKSAGFKYNNNPNKLTADQMFLFNVFAETDTDITQVDEKCIKAEEIFQDTCTTQAQREDAIITCGQILTIQNRRKCVTKYACSPMDVFVDCLGWACSGYEDDELCESVAYSVDFCKVSFKDGNLTTKIKDAKCYTDFLPILED